MAETHPVVLINNYLAEKIANTLSNDYSDTIKFFPTFPTDIGAMVENFPESAGDVFAVYDRMFRLRKSPFPHNKNEQVDYYFYKMSGNPEPLAKTVQLVYELLDGEDESAEDINNWITSKSKNNVINFNGQDFNSVYFHNFRVYQLQETRDVINFNTNRSFVGSKIIIEYNYHSL